MKYFDVKSVVESYKGFQDSMTNKSWGYLALLKGCNSSICPLISYEVNMDVVSNFLENIFNLSQVKKRYEGGRSLYVIFSNIWEKYFNNQGKYSPNIFDVVTWVYRRKGFEDNITLDDIINDFSKEFHIPFYVIKDNFNIQRRNLFFSNSLYSESTLKSELSRIGVDVSKDNIDARKGGVVASPGEITRGPFVQTLYAGLEITDYVLILQSNYNSLYGKKNQGVKSKRYDVSQPLQQIFYGPPGTGKSYNIDKDLKVKNIPETQVKRVIFYPDYTYTDFIGGLLPITDEDDKPKYKFVAGPFTEILKDAFDNSDKSYYIVIEEINRGNPAAIFGDVFQLLDRDSSGKSKYTITNKDICSYLRGNDKDKFANDRFWLPSNFNIICTMNTADQNVFVLDTAFKRRFKMEYVPIDFKKLNKPELEKYIKETDVFAGEKSLKEIFANTDLGTYVSEHEAEMKRNWPTFAQLVNEKINLINRSGDSISEDKKLGPFFISIDELTDKRKFADKVLYYLKQDVFKYTDSVLTPSYQKLYDDFVNGDDDIFELFATAK